MGDSAVQLLADLEAIGLLSPTERRTFDDEPAGDASAILDQLVIQGRVSAFQASLLRAGRGRELRLGNYLIVDKLGEGGMGSVYQAVHTLLHRTVALKTVRRSLSDPAALLRFQREIEALGRLNHPHVVRAAHAAESGGTFYLVMDFVAGLDVMQVSRRRGPLAVNDACEIARQTAVGLQYIHECGLVHRDIKPSNLMLTPEGTVRILDLGLARLDRDPASDRRLTAVGQVVGTVDYIAPEQARGDADIDIRADIYSLGCTLYRLLTGQPPYGPPRYPGKLERLLAHVNEPFPDLRAAQPDAPRELSALVERMVRKDPQERYGSPGEVAVALQSFCGQANLPRLLEGNASPSETAPRPPDDLVRAAMPATVDVPPPRRFAEPARLRTRSILRAAVASLAAALLLLAGWLWFRSPRSDMPSGAALPPRGPARTSTGPSGSQTVAVAPVENADSEPSPAPSDRTPAEQQRFDAAAAVIQRLTGDPEGDAAGYEQLSAILAGIRRSDDLIGLIEQLVAAAPQQEGRRRYAESRLNDFAAAALTRGESHVALNIWNAGLRIHPDSADIFLRRGIYFQDLGEYDRAIADFNESLRLRPDSPLTLGRRGRAWHSKREYDLALADYDKAILLDPDAIGPYNNRGLVWFDLGEYDQAISDYSEHIRRDPIWSVGHANRGHARYAKGDFEQAVADFTEALRLEPTSPSYFNMRGLAHRMNGDLDKAIADFDELLRRNPDVSYAYNNRGLAWRDKGESEKAIADFDAAIRLSPKDPLPYRNRGETRLGQQAYDLAIADFDAAIRLNGNDATAWWYRARAWSAKRDYGRFVSDSGEALRLQPDHALALNALAWLLSTCPDAGQRNGAKAVELARRACELTEWKNWGHIDTLAAAYAENGDFANAASTQQQALDLVMPEDADRSRLQERLELYRSEQPYREP